MTASSPDGYREVASTLTPPAVSQYLAAQNWHLESRREGVSEIWRAAGDRARIMLPLATDYADFRQRFRDALFALGRINDWDPDELQERITAAHSDLFYVRLDQRMRDGTIPFRQAENTVDSIFRMLTAAAVTAANPERSHRGRRPQHVDEFLDEDVRLGHTKPGSFVFTVVTRLPDRAADGIDGSAGATPVTPFARQAMETLAKGLRSTKALTQAWDPYLVDSPSESGVSAGLVESLERMAEPKILRSIDFSFEWAMSTRRPEIGPDRVVLDQEAIAALPRIRERLTRREEPPRREQIVGVVHSLTRGGAADDEAGEVIVLADVNGRERNVHVPLDGEGHRWAIRAYEARLPFMVTGDLYYERRAWRLGGEITVDTSFLRHYFHED